MTSQEWAKAWLLVRQNRLIQICLGILVVVVTMSVLAPLLPIADPTRQDLSVVLRPPAWQQNGSLDHPLGTDFLGRDILSRVIWGSRISLLVGIASVALAVVVGVPLGIVAPYYGGKVDEGIMRAFDVVLSIPNLLAAMAVLVVFGASLPVLILVLGLRSTVWYARTMRSKVLGIREEQFVKAAKALGVTDRQIMWRHILPNSLAPVIVLSTIYIGLMIIIESSLSFLGLTKAHVSWGFMVAEGRDYIATSWWTATIPGIMIFVTVLSVNIIGDFLRDVLDPRLQPRVE